MSVVLFMASSSYYRSKKVGADELTDLIVTAVQQKPQEQQHQQQMEHTVILVPAGLGAGDGDVVDGPFFDVPLGDPASARSTCPSSRKVVRAVYCFLLAILCRLCQLFLGASSSTVRRLQ